MHLLLDIGNQNVKWRFDDRCGSFPSIRLKQISDSVLAQIDSVSGIVFINVAEPIYAEWLRRYAASKWGVDAVQVFSVSEQCGVRNGYHKAEELGADRWAATIGAWSICSDAAVIVDCGTAITVDALSAQGEFIGGSILPGFELARDSLSQRTPGIGAFDGLASDFPARSTIDAVSSGVVYALMGGIDLLVQKYSALVGDNPKLLLTGGASSIVADESTHKFEQTPNLPLLGLQVISNALFNNPSNDP